MNEITRDFYKKVYLFYGKDWDATFSSLVDIKLHKKYYNPNVMGIHHMIVYGYINSIKGEFTDKFIMEILDVE